MFILLQFTSEEDLLPDHIIKRAATNTVDSACTLLNQVTATLLDTLEDYIHVSLTTYSKSADIGPGKANSWQNFHLKFRT